MKMTKMEGKYTKTLLFIVRIAVVMVSIVSTTIAIDWTHYRLEAESVDAKCPPDKVEFNKDEVVDALTCSMICFKTDNCISVFFQPKEHRCIGCQVYQRGAPLAPPLGFVQFAKGGKQLLYWL